MNYQIRNIQLSDNKTLAKIVRETLAEFGAKKPGTVYYDPATDNLFEIFQTPRSTYFVAEDDDLIIGGSGIYPSAGLPDDTCELVKMYLVPDVRGFGIGKHLIEKCLQAAKDFGYEKVYLETLPELKKALKVYEKFGFYYLNAPIGNTGHYGCDKWMLKEI